MCLDKCKTAILLQLNNKFMVAAKDKRIEASYA